MGRKWWKKRRKERIKQQNLARAKGQTVAQPVGKQTTLWEPQVACHDGVVGVFKKGPISFWAGKARDVHMWHDWDLVMCFSDRDSQWEDNDPRPACTHNEGARRILSPELFMFGQRAPFIGLDWPDFGSPSFGRAWWETLIADLLKLDQEEVNVAMCCTGGHGRTGSALSILHGLCWPDAQEDPVEMVRRIYCKNCVESQSQINYIGDILERDLTSKPAWSSNGTRKAGSGYYSQYTTDDRQPQGSAASTKLAELETAAALNQAKSYGAIIQKALDKQDSDGDNEDHWDQEDFVPFGSNMLKDGHIYTPVENAAGDIIGWRERKDVAI